MDKQHKKIESSVYKSSDRTATSEEKFYDCGDVETKMPTSRPNFRSPLKNNTKEYRAQNNIRNSKDNSKKLAETPKNMTSDIVNSTVHDIASKICETTNRKPVKYITRSKNTDIDENKVKTNENSRSKTNINEFFTENSTNNKDHIIWKSFRNNFTKKVNNVMDANVLYEYDRRRKIKEKYTLRLKPIATKVDEKTENSKVHERSTDTNDDNLKTKLTDEKKMNNKISTTTFKIEYTKSKDDNRAKKPETEPEKRRKPQIKTIMAKNGVMPVYKAVKFVDSKTKPVPLQINIPTNNNLLNKRPSPQKISRDTDTNSLKSKPIIDRLREQEKKVVVRNRVDQRRIIKKKRRILSPEVQIRTPSPPTEVAKWAPSCIDELTKPYYEAWVNTTLAAISKDRTFTYNKFMKSLKKNLFIDKPEDLTYENMSDEKYTGKIKVTHR